MTESLSPSAPAASSEVVGLLLAAGGGRRLGGCPKALLEHRGELFVERAARALRDGGCARVHIVLGATADVVREQAHLPGCALVDNPHWREGMGSSLRTGLASLRGSGAGAALVCLVDQPGVGAAAVARVRAAFRSPASLAAATYAGERGHPVLFGADHWDGIAGGARIRPPGLDPAPEGRRGGSSSGALGTAGVSWSTGSDDHGTQRHVLSTGRISTSTNH